MSGGEDFLSRWSRRKREAAEPAPPLQEAAQTPALPPGEASAAPNEAGEAVAKSAAEDFDPASLPPIDSIVEGTDITAFLKQGVPLDLTRAALRRAWSSDPAIRDFVGLAENAWDFNDPNAMPGFGPLDQSPEAIRQMLARVMGEVRPDAEEAMPAGEAAAPVAGPATEPEPTAEIAETETAKAEIPKAEIAKTGTAKTADPADPAAGRSVADDEADLRASPVRAVVQQSQVDIASQQDKSEAVPGGSGRLRRTRGGALPR